MSAAQKLGIVVLALLLITTVGAANVVMTSERTVLNAEFVDQSFAEEDGYSQLRSQVIDAVDNEVAQANPTQSDQIPQAIQRNINITAIVADAVTESYIRNQSRQNLFRLYDFLHGDRPDLVLQVDLEPLKDSLAEAVGEQVRDINISTLVDEFAPATDTIPIEITGERIQTMRASQSGYQEVRASFRDELRNILFERLRQEEPALLLEAIGEDPRQYSSDAERRQAVDRNEQEIKQQIRELTQRGADNSINERFEQELQERVALAKDRVRQETREATSQFSENVTTAAIDVQLALIDGLATDTSYEEFTNRVSAAEEQLANEASRLAAQQIDREVPDTISAADELSQQDRQQLTMLSNRVQQVDTANTFLPVLALILIGLIYLVTRSLGTTALTAGISIALVGVGTFVGARLVGGPVEDFIRNQISGQDTQAIRDLAVGLVDRLLGVLSRQSLLLAVVGVVLILVWVADRQGYLDNLRGGNQAGAAGTAAGQQEPTRRQEGGSVDQQAPDAGGEGVEPLDVGGDDGGSDPLGGDDER